VYQYSNGTYVLLSTGTAFSAQQTWLSESGQQYWGDTDHMWPADVNGDGKTDIVYINTSFGSPYYAVKLSTGSSFIEQAFSFNGSHNCPAGYQFPGDFNGDGKAD